MVGAPGQERFADNSQQIRFGFFSESGFDIFMWLDGNPKVYAVPRFRMEPILYEWFDLQTMLESEVERMSALYKASNGAVNAFNTFPAPWE